MSKGPLPCPWCGKEPIVQPIDATVQGNAWARVECVNINCAAQPSVEDGALQSDERGSNAYKALAIKRWNKRARPTTEGHRE